MRSSGGAPSVSSGGAVRSGGSFRGGVERGGSREFSSFSSRGLASFRPVSGIRSSNIINLSNGLEPKSSVARSESLAFKALGKTPLIDITRPVSEFSKVNRIKPEAKSFMPKKRREGAFVRPPEAATVNNIEPTVKDTTVREAKANAVPLNPVRKHTGRKEISQILFEKAQVAFEKRTQAKSETSNELSLGSQKRKRVFGMRLDRASDTETYSVLKQKKGSSDLKKAHSVRAEIEKPVKYSVAEVLRSKIKSAVSSIGRRTSVEGSVMPATVKQLGAIALPEAKAEEMLMQQVDPAAVTDTRPGLRSMTDPEKQLNYQIDLKNKNQLKTKKVELKKAVFEVDLPTNKKRRESAISGFFRAVLEAYKQRKQKVSGSDVAQNMHELKNRKTDSPSIEGLQEDGSVKKWVEVFAEAGEVKSVSDISALATHAEIEFPATRLTETSMSFTADTKQIKTVHKTPDPFDANFNDRVVKVSVDGSETKGQNLILITEEPSQR